MKYKLWLILLLFIGIQQSAFSQNKVFFYVTDQNKEPLETVGLTIFDENQEYLNQTVMYFPFSTELGKGKYQITATKYGYVQKTDTFTVTESEQIVNIMLQKVKEDVSVGSVKAAPINLQSGSVYVLDRDYIDASGARDLVDLLYTVPGFSFGVDVLGNINNSTRGVWTNEGKFLVMVDGIQINELAYGTMQFGQRFPLENIERIEILRGPASLFNGGLASYGVLNIVMRKHTTQEGLKVASQIGKSDNAITRQSYSAIYNQKFSDNGYINLGGYLGRGLRSTANYKDFQGNSYSMKDNSDILNEQLTLQAGFKGIEFNAFYDNYRYFQMDAYGLNSQRAYPIRYPVAGFNISTQIGLSKKWTLTPFFGYLYQKPYSEKDVILDSIDLAQIGRSTIFDFTAINQMTNRFTLSYQSGNHLEFDFRGELNHDNFRNNEELFPNNLNTFTMQSAVGIANIRVNLLDVSKLNQGKAFYLQGAMRYEKQTYYSAAVPMASANILSGKFHSKLLFGRSFRPPLLENIRLNIENNNGDFTLKPDYTNTIELELGVDITPKSFIYLNLYHNSTSGTITFMSDALGNEDYINGGKIGSQGIEIHSKINIGIGNLFLNFGGYQTNTNDSIFRVPETKVNIGIPSSKFNAMLSLDLEKMFGLNKTLLNFNFLGLSKIYQFANDLGKISTISPASYLSTNLTFQDVGGKGLKLVFGINDIFNQGYQFAQPYNGGHATLPGNGREYILKMVMNINK